MRAVRQLPASMTSVVEAPRAVSSDASPTRPLCAVKRASMPAARAARPHGPKSPFSLVNSVAPRIAPALFGGTEAPCG